MANIVEPTDRNEVEFGGAGPTGPQAVQLDAPVRVCRACAANVSAADRFCAACGTDVPTSEETRAHQAPARQAAPSPGSLAAPAGVVVKQYSARTLAAAIILSALLAMCGAVAISSTVFAHTGPIGPRGRAGAPGASGPIGQPGPRGVRGSRGGAGQSGTNGSNGANGAVVTVPAGEQQTGTDSQGYPYGLDASGTACSDNPSTPQPNCPF